MHRHRCFDADRNWSPAKGILRIRRAGKGLMNFCDFPCSALLGSISGALYHQGRKAAMPSDVARMETIASSPFAIQNQVQASLKAEVRYALGGDAASPGALAVAPFSAWWKSCKRLECFLC
jgi:hypothetical protein